MALSSQPEPTEEELLAPYSLASAEALMLTSISPGRPSVQDEVESYFNGAVETPDRHGVEPVFYQDVPALTPSAPLRPGTDLGDPGTDFLGNSSFAERSQILRLRSQRTRGPRIDDAVFKISAGGYIESAQIRNVFRMRFDAGFDLNRPDRAEYFYATWAHLLDHDHAIKGTDQLITSVNDRGPFRSPDSIDYQEITPYLEWAFNDRLSVFSELPVRFVHFIGANSFETPTTGANPPQAPDSTSGVGDTQFGLKYALSHDSDRMITAQFRTYVPTGDARRGLGTGHVSLEPGLLLYQQLAEEWFLMGQVKLWVPIDGGANAGNIAIYGAGLSYNLYQGNSLSITPVAEFVGWTVLDGFETISGPGAVPNTARVAVDPDITDEFGNPQVQIPAGSGGRPAPTSHGVQVAAGKTIVNAKLGMRISFTPRDDIYVGYGRALTGPRWYQDIARVEYRRAF